MSSGKVYSAVYSGVQVYEMMIHGIATMVRGEDSYLNATQILKVAGFEKTRRSKILEREVLIGEHEKVQGGYGKYQGTWIPFEKGKELAERYEVLDSLMPLLNFDPSTLKNEEKHDDVSSPSKTPLLLPAPPSPKAQKRPKHTQSQARKKLKLVGVSPEPIGPEDAFYEHHRNLLMSIFLSDNPDDVPSLLSSVLLTKDLNIDLVIDEQGHTALHWAAALGRVRVVELLIQNGANVCRLNYEGETPLMRAAMITCCYEKKCFMEMVEMLADSVHVTDDRGRTVLHHIALTASVEGYTDAAIYYMKRFVKAVPKKSILKNILNIKDTQYYESALAIALRLECQDIVDVLIKQGATDPLITKMEEEQNMEFDPVDYKTKSKGPDMIKTMQHMIEKLEDDYQEQLRKKDMVAFELRRELGMVKYELREAQRRLDFPVSMQLAEARKRIAQLEAQVSQEEPMIIDESNEEEDKSTKERKLEKKIKSLQSQADMNIKTIERLQHELEAEKKRAHDKEMEYRRLIAASCGLPIERIDALIKPLTLAVESDPPDLDMARVIALMEKPTA